ncbi:hypothetical protein [Acinetobacter junii]|nr:hypothetical protein [Acinetobacter junii]ENV52099.1 hypothetical protein F953_00511 [Acinetobacter junii CIP 107470 = MTCC 11364]
MSAIAKEENMRIQTLQFKTKVIAFDRDRKLTLYSLDRMEEEPENLSAEVKVVEDDEVQITDETAQKLLGLNILPFDLHAQKGYGNFNM